MQHPAAQLTFLRTLGAYTRTICFTRRDFQ
jgi:hypothetical protein